MRMLTLAVLCVGTLLAGGCTSGEPKPNPNPPPGTSGITMKITPSKAEYLAGEAVQLKVELTNGEAGECRVSKVTEGTLTIISFTRDAKAVAPGIGEGSYIDGMSSYLRQSLVTLAPGKTVAMELNSAREGSMDKRHVLETSAMDSLDSATLTFWPVSAPGVYRIEARYTPPPLANAPGPLCRASGEPAQASFTVKGA